MHDEFVDTDPYVDNVHIQFLSTFQLRAHGEESSPGCGVICSADRQSPQGEYRTQNDPPNLILQPKTGSIYKLVKRQKRGESEDL